MNERYIVRGLTLGGEWVYGYLSILDKKIHYGVDIPAGYYISNEAGKPFAYPVRPETVGKPTTLKDKNGKLIFENDIVKGTFFHAFPELNFIGTIFWHNDVAGFGMNEWDLATIEVIGNIHQNRELLEKGGK